MMKHVTRAVHALMQDADAHDLLLNLYGRCFHVLLPYCVSFCNVMSNHTRKAP